MRCLASACGRRRNMYLSCGFDSIGLAIRASRAILLGLLVLLCNNEARHPNCWGAQILSCRPFNSLKIFSDSSLRRRAYGWSDVGASEISQWSTQTDSLRWETMHKRSTAPSSQLALAPLCRAPHRDPAFRVTCRVVAFHREPHRRSRRGKFRIRAADARVGAARG
jgi:hypothetical protein